MIFVREMVDPRYNKDYMIANYIIESMELR